MSTNQLSPKTREQNIIELLQKRDDRGLILLYEHYSAALFHIILRIVRTEDTAQDVLQESFVKIWKQSEAYDPKKGRLFTWMARIVKNAAIDKTRSKIYKSEKRTDSIENFVSDNTAFSESMYTADSGLRDVVNKLDDKYRQIIEYLFFKDFTQSEAAEALGLPLGTVKSRSRLAIKALRGLLQNEQLIFILLFFFA